MGIDIEDLWMFLLEEDMVGVIGLYVFFCGRECELFVFVVVLFFCYLLIIIYFVIFVIDN